MPLFGVVVTVILGLPERGKSASVRSALCVDWTGKVYHNMN
jgi:hypothetical protein